MAFYNSLPLIGLHLKSNSRLDIFSVEEQAQLQAEYRENLGIGKNTTFSADAFDTLAASRIKDFDAFKEEKAHDGKSLDERFTSQSANASNNEEQKKALKNVKALKQAEQDVEALKQAGQNDAELMKAVQNVETLKQAVQNDEEQKKAVQHIEALKQAIKDNLVIEPNSKFSKAQKDYQESVATFRELADKIPYKYKPQDLIDLMAEIKGKAIESIKEQQQHEIRAFEDPAFKEKLANSLGLKIPDNQADVDASHNNMMKVLKDSHSTQLAEFEKSTTASLTALHTASAAEMSQLLFIANIRKNNIEMQQKIAGLAAAKRAQAGLDPVDTNVVVGINKDQISLTGITVADLGTIKSITGKEIYQDGKGNFSMNMEGYSLNPLASLNYFAYSQDPRQNIKADMLLMAQAVRASGYDKITMTVDFENPDVANTRARQAYEAAILAGFPKDKIVIQVNGNAMKHEDIFKSHPVSFQRINQKSSAIIAGIAKLNNPDEFKIPSSGDLTAIRKEMESLRANAQQNAPQPQAPSAGIQP